MRRLAFVITLAACTLVRAASIAIDPAALNLSPAECQTVCKAGPVIPPSVPPSVPPTPPSSPPGWGGFCAGFAKTVVVPMEWNNPQRMFTSQWGGFGPNDALVVRFTTGSVPASSSLPRIAAGEYQSPPSPREWTVSETPCDFGPQGWGSSASGTPSVTFTFGLGNPSGSIFIPTLKLNATYYLNVKNAAVASCSLQGVCDMFIDLVKPGGL